MSLPDFEYILPKSIEEACSFISRYSENGKVMAGGTDLLPLMKDRSMALQTVIDLKGIPGLDFIDVDNQDGLRIGALATMNSIERSLVVRERFSVLAHAAQTVGSVQIRNRATVVGNLCNAAPGADMTPSLMALGATLRVVGISSEREVPLEDFFVGPGKTILRKDEVVSEIRVPGIPPRTGVFYHKHSPRKAMDLALVGVAAKIGLAQGEQKCEDVRIILGAVGPTAIRARKAEAVLLGKKIDDDLVAKASEEAAAESLPRSSSRGAAEYKMEMVKVFTKRSILESLKIATASK